MRVAGDGPTLIEAKVVRRRGHYAGDPQNYRPAADLEGYRDPLELLAARLPIDAAQRIRADAELEAQQAYEAALAAPEPDPSVIYRDLYHGA